MRAAYLLAIAALLLAPPALAQPVKLSGPSARPPAGNQPVTFIADSVTYDRAHDLVIASGHVQAWQDGRTLFADRVIFDRSTNVVAATGHVSIMETNGQTLFADYAELTRGMRDAVLKGMSARLAEHGKLVAAGARRTGGLINEMARAVYTTCPICLQHPDRPPLWDLRARLATEDLQNKRIEYRDVWLDMFGLPVAWFPYFWHVDPSVKRASGLLVPTIGQSTHLGQYVSVPYYWVLDNQSDLTLTPTITTQAGPQLGLQYRRAFNNGRVTVNSSIAEEYRQFQGHVFAKGQFVYNDEWRYGFDVNRATSSNYLRDYRIADSGAPYLTSEAYVEGFGQGAYTRLDTRLYQGLTTQIQSTSMPEVLPHYQYHYFGRPDALGGRLSVDADAFNVLRGEGTNTQRAALSAQWDRPFTGADGDLWTVSLRMDAAGYEATSLNLAPNFSPISAASTARALPQAAVMVRWPWMHAGPWGQQIIEPIVQVIAAPNTGTGLNARIPNEDSLDLQFTDANLFSFNRYPGIDRLEGGLRANVGLHGAWYFPDGTMLDLLAGQSYRPHPDNTFPIGSGLTGTVSDYVARVSVVPNKWFDVTARGRFDHSNGSVRYGEAVAGFGRPLLHLTGGYIYDTTNPYGLYSTAPGAGSLTSIVAATPRNEVSMGFSSQYREYSVTGFVRRDLATNKLVAVGGRAAYDDQCFTFEVDLYHRYTSLNGDNGAQTILFQLTFKTVGQFGFHAF